jgi:predicted transcriptional regulator
MAIYRVHKKNDYTMINNYLIKDKNLQLKDKGMLLVLLSLPNDWDFSVVGLEKICKETKDTINGILNNLQKYNYLKRDKKRDDKGRFIDWQYDIYEIPKDLYDDLPHPKNQDMDNRDMDFPDMENYTQLNTNKESTKELNTKLKEIYKERFEEFYQAYPKHLKKAEVEKWFYKNKPDETLFNTIMTQLEKFKQCKEWKQQQYIPYPSTWLNQKRWEDEIKTQADIDKEILDYLKEMNPDEAE